MLEGTWRSKDYGFFLFASACELHLWAIVVLGQAVGSAELSAAVRTLEGKKRFLPAFAAFHVFFRAFSSILRTKPFIRFPKN
jgi:hypothetical protein